MTCAHVLDLSNAGPFAAVPRARLDAAWAHARGCATCGPALTQATEIETDLRILNEPPVPAGLADAVLARIADLPAASPAPAVPETRSPDDARWPAWTMALGTVSAVMAPRFAITLKRPAVTPTYTMPAAMAPAMSRKTWSSASFALCLSTPTAPAASAGRRSRRW